MGSAQLWSNVHRLWVNYFPSFAERKIESTLSLVFDHVWLTKAVQSLKIEWHSPPLPHLCLVQIPGCVLCLLWQCCHCSEELCPVGSPTTSLQTCRKPPTSRGTRVLSLQGCVWRWADCGVLSRFKCFPLPQVLQLLQHRCGGQCRFWQPGGLPKGSWGPLCQALQAFLCLVHPHTSPGFNL